MGELIMEKGEYRNTRKIACLLWLIVAAMVVWTGYGYASTEGEVDLFERAYGYYLDYQPELAATAFGLFLEKFGESPARDAALFWQAKSLALTGRTEEAGKIFAIIGEEYPESAFESFARKELGALPLRAAREEDMDRGAKGQTKRDGREQGCEGLRVDTEKCAAQVKELSGRLRESEAKAAGLTMEKDNMAAEIRKAQREKDEAITALRDAELKLPEVNDVAIRLREREKFQKEQDEYIKKLREETNALIAGIKERDAKISDAGRTIASLRSQLAGGEDARKKRDERVAERDNDEMRKLRNASAEKDGKIAELVAKVQETEKALADKGDTVKKLSGEKAAYEEKIKEAEAAKTELKRVRDEYEKLKTEFAKSALEKQNAAAVESRKPVQPDAELKQKLDRLQKHNSELKAEVSALNERIARYEAPVVRIGDKTYSMAEIADERRNALKVLSKIGASPVWRKGDVYEDFITGRLLMLQATDKDVRKANDEAAKLADSYLFDKGEREYLTEYLTCEEVVRRKKSGDAPGEREVKDYYEAHRNEYLKEKEDRSVKYLVMRFRKGDKLGRVALVSELQREAGNGKSFEEIARSRNGTVSLKHVRFEELPGWIAEKIRVLKDGEISTIFTEGQFILLQMRVKGPVYRRYEDVRGEISRKLAPKAEGPADLNEWLAGLRKEAVEIR